jgi:hypothetical protein
MMARIGAIIPVTAVPLTCAALQTFDAEYIPEARLLARIEELRDTLVARGAEVVEPAREASETFERALSDAADAARAHQGGRCVCDPPARARVDQLLREWHRASMRAVGRTRCGSGMRCRRTRWSGGDCQLLESVPAAIPRSRRRSSDSQCARGLIVRVPQRVPLRSPPSRRRRRTRRCSPVRGTSRVPSRRRSLAVLAAAIRARAVVIESLKLITTSPGKKPDPCPVLAGCWRTSSRLEASAGPNRGSPRSRTARRANQSATLHWRRRHAQPLRRREARGSARRTAVADSIRVLGSLRLHGSLPTINWRRRAALSRLRTITRSAQGISTSMEWVVTGNRIHRVRWIRKSTAPERDERDRQCQRE